VSADFELTFVTIGIMCYILRVGRNGTVLSPNTIELVFCLQH